MAKRLASYTALLRAQEAGLVLVILALVIVISSFSGSYVDHDTGRQVSTFLNARSLIQVASDTSLFAIMAVGATVVIISGGIDLSVGSVYALAAVSTALYMKHTGSNSIPLALGMCVGIGTVCGALNGAMVSYLKVHPFIITLGTMWIFRGLSYVISRAVSISFPDSAISAVKSNLGLQAGLYPVPTIVMVLVSVAGLLYLSKTTGGRNVYALGGNEQASRYSGIRIGRVLVGVYTLAGLCAGVAAFIGSSFYGAASCADAQGYELKVIASAVVGGASLTGGKGGALGALLGAIVVNLIGQAITYLHLSRDYESIIIGFAVIFAVLLDQWSRKLAQRRATS